MVVVFVEVARAPVGTAETVIEFSENRRALNMSEIVMDAA